MRATVLPYRRFHRSVIVVTEVLAAPSDLWNKAPRFSGALGSVAMPLVYGLVRKVSE